MADSAVTPDKVDRYEIISILGEGGTGIVYKAFDPILQKIVAIKVLEAEIDQANVQHVRFQREARALRDLHHDAVPLVYDFAITSDGAPYMVMEYIEGTPLSTIISARKGLTIDEFLDFGLQICAVLIYAHRHGIVHRDIKPSNIILVKEGEGFAAHLVDFGLVKLEAPDLSEDDEKIKNIGVSTDELTSGVQFKTKTGTVLGTPQYMSPEQIRCQKIDRRSDIYSFGCVLFEMLAGVPPYQADNAVRMGALHMSGEIPDLPASIASPEQWRELNSLVRKCLAKSPADRYQSADELQQALLAFDSKFGELLAPLPAAAQQAKPSGANEDKAMESVRSLLARTGSATLSLTQPQGEQAKGKTALITAVVLLLCGVVGVSVLTIFRADAPKPVATTTKADLDFAKLAESTKVNWSTRGNGNGVLGTPNASDESFAELKGRHLQEVISDESNLVTGDGVKFLIEEPVETLKLESPRLDDRLLENAAKLKHLSFLNVRAATQFTKKGFEALSKSSSLTTLYFLDCKIPEGGLDCVCRIKTLRAVRFDANSGLENVDWSKLRSLPHLVLLGLRAAPIADADLLRIKELKNLERLYLANTPLTGKYMETFASLPLTELDLSGTKINNEMLRKLAKIKTLQRLEVENCTGVTAGGINELKARRPDLSINENKDSLPAGLAP